MPSSPWLTSLEYQGFRTGEATSRTVVRNSLELPGLEPPRHSVTPLTARTGESRGSGIVSRTRTQAPVDSSGSCSLYSACSPALSCTWIPVCPTSGANAPVLLCASTSAATARFPRFCRCTADQHCELDSSHGTMLSTTRSAGSALSLIHI